MRILHTSDWHIGKKVNDISLLSDQRHVFNQIYEIIKKEKIDVVVVAGDIYDTAIVSTDAVKLLDEVLSKIVNDLKCKVVMITGNHDSGDRLSFGRSFLSSSGVYVEGKFNGSVSKVTLNDEYGEINFYPLSYFNNEDVKFYYDKEEIETHNDAFKVIMDDLFVDYSKRNVFIAHGYFSNKDGDKLIESESERKLTIGGQEIIDASILKDFEYVAFGHLHSRQKVIYDHIRYSGSILKYSFSEINQIKSVTIVDIKEKGTPISFKQIDLKLLYDMKEIEGYIDTLLDREFYKDLNLDDYYRIILHDSIGVNDPASKLRKIYKNFMEIRFRDFIESTYDLDDVTNEDIIAKSPIELFKSFYLTVASKEVSDDQVKILEDVLRRIERGEDK